MPASRDSDLDPAALLPAILRLGENLCDALDAGDLEAVERITTERGAMIERLNAQAASVRAGTDWAAYGTALREQHHRLAQRMQAQETRLNDRLGEARAFRVAKQRYGPADTGRSRFLNKNLHG